MSAPRLAWGLFGLFALLAIAATVVHASRGDALDAAISPGLGVLAGVGAVVASRMPSNPIGWSLLVTAVLISVSGATEGYVDLYDDARDAPGGELALWVDNWIFFVWLGLIAIVIPLTFPDGKLVSRRWKPVARAGLLLMVLAMLTTAFGAPRLEWDDNSAMDNPFAVPGAVGRALDGASSVAELLFVLVIPASVTALVIRLRRSRGVERQQLKWFAYVAALMLVGLVLAGGQESLGLPVLLGSIGWSLFLLCLLFGLPLAIGTAILRHRLYDIDVVINRTLVYGVLTAALIGSYLGLVLLFQLVLSPLTEQSDLAIAGSTLAVAALFRPLRERIQGLVDRRFYRRKYDAAHTIEAFSARLRDQVELDALSSDLTHTVRETMEPAHVSLWLRPSRGGAA